MARHPYSAGYKELPVPPDKVAPARKASADTSAESQQNEEQAINAGTEGTAKSTEASGKDSGEGGEGDGAGSGGTS